MRIGDLVVMIWDTKQDDLGLIVEIDGDLCRVKYFSRSISVWEHKRHVKKVSA